MVLQEGRTISDIGIKKCWYREGDVKNSKKSADVFYGQPHFKLATVSAVGRSENLGGQVVM